MSYRLNQKITFIKDNSRVPVARRFFITGHKYKIARVAESYIQITSEKDICTFKNKFVDQYFKIIVRLNKNTKII